MKLKRLLSDTSSSRTTWRIRSSSSWASNPGDGGGIIRPSDELHRSNSGAPRHNITSVHHHIRHSHNSNDKDTVIYTKVCPKTYTAFSIRVQGIYLLIRKAFWRVFASLLIMAVCYDYRICTFVTKNVLLSATMTVIKHVLVGVRPQIFPPGRWGTLSDKMCRCACQIASESIERFKRVAQMWQTTDCHRQTRLRRNV